jgi:hypothetical protein
MHALQAQAILFKKPGVISSRTFHRNGKPVETLGRKTTGPLKWQPVTEWRDFS